MKILVVNNMAPFIRGGAEELASHLCTNLAKAGHQAELLRIPFQWEPASGIPAQMLLVRALEAHGADRVIALKFPAYLLRHREKTIWLLHQYRQAYDLFDAGQTNLPQGRAGDDLRALIKAGDQQAFSESRAIFCNSEVTRDRLKRYNGFDASVLLPPVNDPEIFVPGSDDGYVFAGGRVNAMKRQHLLVEAAALVPGCRLVIAGPPDSESDAQRIHEYVKRLDVADRVHLDLRFLPRADYARYLNGARAVAYLPVDEDSLGYVAMEAATAAKPILTTSDSGGVRALVRDGATGWEREPEASSLASALAEVAGSPGQCAEKGFAARELWESFGVTWEAVVRALVR